MDYSLRDFSFSEEKIRKKRISRGKNALFQSKIEKNERKMHFFLDKFGEVFRLV